MEQADRSGWQLFEHFGRNWPTHATIGPELWLSIGAIVSLRSGSIAAILSLNSRMQLAYRMLQPISGSLSNDTSVSMGDNNVCRKNIEGETKDTSGRLPQLTIMHHVAAMSDL